MTEAAEPKRERIAPMAWVVWGIAAGFYGYAFFQRVLPSVMVDQLMAEFALGGALLGNLSAFYFYAYAGLQLPVGMLIDRFGPRVVLAVAAALCAGGSVLFSRADSIELAYLGRFLIGAGAAFTWVGALTLAARWFPARRFALLTGLTIVFGMLGAISGQGPAATLLGGVGWRAVLLGAGAVGLGFAALILLAVRNHPPKSNGGKQSPPAAKSIIAGLRVVVRNPQSWILAFCTGLISVPLLAFGALWGVPYMMQVYGVGRPEAAFSVSVMLVGMAIGGPAIGWISDRIGRRRRPLIIGIVLILTTLMAMFFIPGLPLDAFRVLLFVNGLGSGCFVVCYAAVRETNSSETAGTALGLVNMFTIGSGAASQPIVGLLLDLGWDGRMQGGARFYSPETYQNAFLVLPICAGIALLLSFFVRETWCKPID